MIGNDLKKVVDLIAQTLKIKENSLCFCGSGKVFLECCKSNSGSNLLFLQNAFETARAYKDSQGGQIRAIPTGIWNKILGVALNRFFCLYPQCLLKAVNCHLIPENVLRSNFGGHCKEYKSENNSSNWQFIRTGIREAGALPVFCSLHDSTLFKEIDELKSTPLSQKQLLIFAFKTTAFSLRNTQYLLSVDSQLEVSRPFYIVRDRKPSDPIRYELQLDPFLVKYHRFIMVNDFFKESLDAYKSLNYNFFFLF